MLAQLISFIIASALLTISPGPDIIYVLIQSISNGKKAGILTTLGLASGIIIHTTLVAFGISALIKESESLFLLIKIFGACYLFYLAYKVFVSNEELVLAETKINSKSNWQLYKQGFVMNVLNPKVTIFFLAFFPAFLWKPEKTIHQFYILGLIFLILTIIIFGMVALLAGRISVYLRKNPQFSFVLKWLQIVIFILIGVLILI